MSGQARRSRRRRRKLSFAQVVAFDPGRMSPRQAMLAARERRDVRVSRTSSYPTPTGPQASSTTAGVPWCGGEI
jgi:hypothetical protein